MDEGLLSNQNIENLSNLFHSHIPQVKPGLQEAENAIHEMLADKYEGDENQRNLIKKQLENYDQNIKDTKEALRIAKSARNIAIATLIVAALTLLLTALLL